MREIIKLSEETDPLNEKYTRHSQNTSVDAYNCLAYATSTFSWLLPYKDFDDRLCDVEDMLKTLDYDDCANVLLNLDKHAIIEMFGDRIREVKPTDKIEDDERLIAFREYVGEDMDDWSYDDTDFHAIVKLGDTWYEKCGANTPRRVNLSHPWENPSGFYYNSDTVYFALKEN